MNKGSRHSKSAANLAVNRRWKRTVCGGWGLNHTNRRGRRNAARIMAIPFGV